MLVATLGLILAYFWTGYEMVASHLLSPPGTRPAYTQRRSLFVTLWVFSIWPRACYLNGELSWFGCWFMTSALVISTTVGLLKNHTGYWLAALTIVCLRIYVPVLSSVYGGIIALVSGIVAALLGVSLPESIKRADEHQTMLRRMGLRR